ncbi:MAG: HD domain-containing protein [Firmicutes bacterium]|nr:HD domain-containing protein [Bacillota bacterium]
MFVIEKADLKAINSLIKKHSIKNLHSFEESFLLSILDKPSRLTDEEFEIMKTHTEVGYSILKAADEYSDLAEHALYHHERWDGKGYPKGLKDIEIPLFSRIICVCDSFEAMTAERPYKKKMTIDEAVVEIKRCSGSQFDPQLAQIFVKSVLKKAWI